MELWIRILGIVLGTIFVWVGFFIASELKDYTNPINYFEKLTHVILSSVLLVGLAVAGHVIVILAHG